MSDNKTYEPQLTDNEKVIAMRSIFTSENNSSGRYVKNAADFIAGNFEKIEGFDFRWTSLITNNPLLFEDIDYLRVKPFVDNTITDEEKEAYKRGELRELYMTFDNMLMCNLRHYDRIMAYCTMVFMHYVNIDGEYITKSLDKMHWEISMTPTKIWCCAMTSPQSTPWELAYGWGKKSLLSMNFKKSEKTPIELCYSMLYKLPVFSKFIEYAALRCGTVGFRATFVNDTTTNRKLSQVCAKFTKTSVAISDQQLETIYSYSRESESAKDKLFAALDKCMSILFNGDSGKYSIFIFAKEYYIYTNKFTLKVHLDANGVISKDYLANTYECFVAEEFLVQSIRAQIDWSKHKIPTHFEYDKNILKSLLANMLEERYREIMCIKRMNDYGVLSKITFSGIFSNVKIIEEFMIDNRAIKTMEKVLSKRNAANYIIERGYYLFGLEKDIFAITEISRLSLIEHYSNYCVPVISHMFDVIAVHELSKNDIIDVVIQGGINSAKLNNDNIRYTNLMSNDPKQLFATGLERQNQYNLGKKKSYWKAIED